MLATRGVDETGQQTDDLYRAWPGVERREANRDYRRLPWQDRRLRPVLGRSYLFLVNAEVHVNQ